VYASHVEAMHEDGGIIGDLEFSDATECGHCMHFRDFYVAYAFFGDVFDTWVHCAGGTNRASTNSNLSTISSAEDVTTADADITSCFGPGPGSSRGKRFQSFVEITPVATINGWSDQFSWDAESRGTQYLTLQAMGDLNEAGDAHLEASHQFRIHVTDAGSYTTIMEENKACYGFYGCSALHGRAAITTLFAKGTTRFFGDIGTEVESTLGDKAAASKDMAEKEAATRNAHVGPGKRVDLM